MGKDIRERFVKSATTATGCMLTAAAIGAFSPVIMSAGAVILPTYAVSAIPTILSISQLALGASFVYHGFKTALTVPEAIAKMVVKTTDTLWKKITQGIKNKDKPEKTRKEPEKVNTRAEGRENQRNEKRQAQEEPAKNSESKENETKLSEDKNETTITYKDLEKIGVRIDTRNPNIHMPIITNPSLYIVNNGAELLKQFLSQPTKEEILIYPNEVDKIEQMLKVIKKENAHKKEEDIAPEAYITKKEEPRLLKIESEQDIPDELIDNFKITENGISILSNRGWSKELPLGMVVEIDKSDKTETGKSVWPVKKEAYIEKEGKIVPVPVVEKLYSASKDSLVYKELEDKEVIKDGYFKLDSGGSWKIEKNDVFIKNNKGQVRLLKANGSAVNQYVLCNKEGVKMCDTQDFNKLISLKDWISSKETAKTEVPKKKPVSRDDDDGR